MKTRQWAVVAEFFRNSVLFAQKHRIYLIIAIFLITVAAMVALKELGPNPTPFIYSRF